MVKLYGIHGISAMIQLAIAVWHCAQTMALLTTLGSVHWLKVNMVSGGSRGGPGGAMPPQKFFLSFKK